jgi:lysozyme
VKKSSSTIFIVATVVVLLLFATPASAALEDFIKKVEEDGNAKLRAYDDGFGNWTIGFGSTYNWDKARPVQKNDTITIDQAYKFMRLEIADVLDDIKLMVKVPVNQNQTFALASLGYNIGTGALRSSTLIKQLNAGYPKKDVADRFLDFVLATNNRTGRKEFSQGLKNRRELERDLFLS